MKSKLDVFTGNSVWLFLGRVVSTISAMAVSLIVLRRLSVQEFGYFSLISTTSTVFGLLSIAPVTGVFVRYLPAFDERLERDAFLSLLLAGLTYGVLCCFVVNGIVTLWCPQVWDFFQIPRGLQGPSVFWFFITGQMASLINSVVACLLMQRSMALFQIAQSIGIPLIYLWNWEHISTSFLLNVSSLFMICNVVYSVSILIRRLGISTFSFKIDAKRIAKYGFLTMLNEIGAAVIGKTSDFYVVASLGSPIQVGLFSFSYRVLNIIQAIFPIKEMQTVLKPIFVKTGISGGSLGMIFNMIWKLLFPLYLFPAVIFVIWGKQIIPQFFGEKFLDAYGITCVVLLSNALSSLFFGTGLVIILREKMEVALYAKFVALVCVIGGVWGMINYGAIGVVVATMLGDFLRNMYMHYHIVSSEKTNFVVESWRGFPILAFVLLGAFFVNQSNLYEFGRMGLILCILSFCVILWGIWLFCGPFSARERDFVWRLIDSLKRKVTTAQGGKRCDDNG